MKGEGHMARTATARKAPLPTTVTPSPARTALARLAQNFSINLAPFPEEQQALAFRDEAAGITVTDFHSHKTALETLRRGKALERATDAHWRKVLRWLEDRKVEIRTILGYDLEHVAPGVTRLNAQIIAYETAEKQREAAQAEALRQAEARRAQEARDRELADMERQALAAESQSEQLSDRERAFVQECFRVAYRGLGVDQTSAPWLNKLAVFCGFKQDGYGVLLFNRPKIQYALEALRKATALREQAAAIAEKPVEVRHVEVESQRAKVSGVRSHVSYTGECVNFDLFIDRFVAGEVDRTTFQKLVMPNTVGGNEMARALRENFDRIPGWRCVRKETKGA